MKIKKINRFFDVNTESVVVRRDNGHFYNEDGKRVVLCDDNTSKNIAFWQKNSEYNFNTLPARNFELAVVKPRKKAVRKTNEINKMTFTATKRDGMYVIKFMNKENKWHWGGWKIKANVEKSELPALLKKLHCPKEIQPCKGSVKDFPDWAKFEKAVDKYNGKEKKEAFEGDFGTNWKLEIRILNKHCYFTNGREGSKVRIKLCAENGYYWYNTVICEPVDDDIIEESWYNCEDKAEFFDNNFNKYKEEYINTVIYERVRDEVSYLAYSEKYKGKINIGKDIQDRKIINEFLDDIHNAF